MAEVLFRAKLQRENTSVPWGFRLQGGSEFSQPLTILKVANDSVAAKVGLHAGDIVVRLAGSSADGMTYKDALTAIRAIGDTLEIIVERAEATICPSDSPLSPSETMPSLSRESTDSDSTDDDEKAPSTCSKQGPKQQNNVKIVNDKTSKEARTKPASCKQAREEMESAPTNSVESNETSDMENGETCASEPEATSTKTTTNTQDSVSHNAVELKSNKSEILNSNDINADPRTTETSVSTPDSGASHNNIDGAKKKDAVKSVSSDSKTTPTNTTVTCPQDSSIGHNDVDSVKTKTCDFVNSSERSECFDDNNPCADTPMETSDGVLRHADVAGTKTNTGDIVKCNDTSVICQKVKTDATVASSVKGNDKDRTGKSEAQNEQIASKSNESAESGMRRQENDRKKTQSTKPLSADITDETKTAHSSEKQGGTAEPFKVMRNIAGQIIMPSNIPEKSKATKPPTETETVVEAAGDTAVLADTMMARQAVGQERLLRTHADRTNQEKPDPGKDEVPKPSTDAPALAGQKSPEPKDFSKTAPWRVPQLLAGGRASPASPDVARTPEDGPRLAGSLPSPLKLSKPVSSIKDASRIVSKVIQRKVLSEMEIGTDATYPWRKPRLGRDVDSPLLSPSSPDVTPTLTFVGKKTLLSGRSAEQPTRAPSGGDVYFTEVDAMSMPAVKEMVADLDRRLEAIAVQHPKIVQPLHQTEPGLSFVEKAAGTTRSRSDQEKEIIIDSAPRGDVKQRLFGGTQGNTKKYQRLYDVTSPLTSPSPTRKHFCWPPEEPVQVKSCQRRVHFAEPVEQSVIEIEPRRPRRREQYRQMSPDAVSKAESVKVLTETLDRIERENDMMAASSRGPPTRRPDLTQAQGPARHPDYVYPTVELHWPGHELHNFESPRQNILVSSSPARHGLQVTVGQPSPGHMDVSMVHRHAAATRPDSRMDFTLPRAGSAHPTRVTYAIPRRQPLSFHIDPSHAHSHSADDSPGLIHISYPPQPTYSRQGPATAAGPLSPPGGYPSYAQPAQGTGVVYRPANWPPPLSPSTPTSRYVAVQHGYSPTGYYSADGGKLIAVGRQVAPRRYSVDVTAARPTSPSRAASTAGGPGPGPYSQGRRETPEENRPAMRAIIPQPMSPPLDLYSSPSAVAAYERIPGLFALFDKSFSEKFLQWQSQREPGLQQSETYKMVRQMDADERHKDTP